MRSRAAPNYSQPMGVGSDRRTNVQTLRTVKIVPTRYKPGHVLGDFGRMLEDPMYTHRRITGAVTLAVTEEVPVSRVTGQVIALLPVTRAGSACNTPVTP